MVTQMENNVIKKHPTTDSVIEKHKINTQIMEGKAKATLPTITQSGETNKQDVTYSVHH